MPKPASIILTVMLGLYSVITSANELVVIAADHSTFQPGAIIKGDTILNLAQGERLTLVSSAGKTISLQGPYQGPAQMDQDQVSSAVVASLSRLLKSSNSSTVIAAFRGASGSQSINPFAINVSRSGTYCVLKPATLRRKKSKHEDSVSIELLATGQRVTQTWPVGESTLAWPQSLILKDGARYSVKLDSALNTTEITLQLITADLPTDVHRAAWMGENNCEKQAREILRQLVN